MDCPGTVCCRAGAPQKLLAGSSSWSVTGVFSPQRGTMRRRYEDDGISDDEIEGKRTFDLEEKLSTNKFNSTFVVFMEGKGLSGDSCPRAFLRKQRLGRALMHLATPRASLAASSQGGNKSCGIN